MGFSKGGSSRSNNTSTTVYPGEFLPGFEARYGRGVGIDELIGALPQTSSIFGGGQGFTSATGQSYQPPGGAGAGAGAGTIGLDVIGSAIQSQFQGNPQGANRLMAELQSLAGPGGTGISLDQLRNYAGRSPRADFIRSSLPAMLEQFTQAPQQRFAASAGPDLSALQIPQSIQRLFGAQAQQSFNPYTIREVPGITAPTAQAAQMNVGDLDRYERALFESQYRPQAREIEQQGGIADRRLQAELAQAGLASSGSGIGQVQQQRADRMRDLQARAADAAQQATTQRFGAEFAQQQFNAQQQQQTALANAGFDLEAQKTNAANLLAGDTARADNYLKTMGLNVEAASAMRDDFLQLLGITQEEMKRLDASQMEKLGVVLNNWLQQGALLGNLGQRGRQTSSSGGGAGGGLTITGQGSTT